MMSRIYTIENLDCANCAAKIEGKFNALPQVEEAVITFATKQLRLTADDPDGLLPELEKIARTVEGEVVIRPREAGHGHHSHGHHEGYHHAEGCGCGHHHAHGEGCGCGHHHAHGEGCACGHQHGHEEEHSHSGGEGWILLTGAGLFALGLGLGLIRQAWAGYVSWVLYGAAYLVLGWDVLKTAG